MGKGVHRAVGMSWKVLRGGRVLIEGRAKRRVGNRRGMARMGAAQDGTQTCPCGWAAL